MSANARWLPGNDELDAVARTLPAAQPDADRAEHNRTSLLASAASVAQLPRRSLAPILVGVTAALAAAAGILLWINTRPNQQAPKEQIVALGPASFERVSGWPNFVISLDEGRVSVAVATLDSTESFRVRTRDAEVDVHGTRFVVAAHDGSLQSLSVTDGRVELRRVGEPVVFLAAGQSWPVQTAQRDELMPSHGAVPDAPVPLVTGKAENKPIAPERGPVATPSDPVTIAEDAPATAAKAVTATTQEARPKRTAAPGSGSSPATTPSPGTVSSSPIQNRSTDAASNAVTVSGPPSSPPYRAPAPALAAKPGELEFRNGVAALRAGDAAGATKAFTTACAAAQADGLSEDACFWVGAAAKRAGDTAAARDALTRYVQRFPRSPRAGEAAALLGWILYDANELDAAEVRFRQGAKDRIPKIRESAERGLTAVARKRAP